MRTNNMCFHGEIRKIFTCCPILPGAMLGHLLLANSTGQISGLFNMSHIVTKIHILSIAL